MACYREHQAALLCPTSRHSAALNCAALQHLRQWQHVAAIETPRMQTAPSGQRLGSAEIGLVNDHAHQSTRPPDQMPSSQVASDAAGGAGGTEAQIEVEDLSSVVGEADVLYATRIQKERFACREVRTPQAPFFFFFITLNQSSN